VSGFHYTADGCWSSDWQDAEGHNTPGVQSKFTVTITNSGQLTSGYIWIVVKTTDEYSDTTPNRTYSNWPERVSWAYVGPKDYYLPGPQITHGTTRTLNWDAVFHTAGDVHYTVTLIAGPDPKTDPGALVIDGSDVIHSWSVWTSSRVCF
jgi:CARDB.